MTVQMKITQLEEAKEVEAQISLDPDAIDPEELDPKTANIVYHDWEARSYDDKWSISFDERCISYAREKFLKVAPERHYGKVLEIGSGTGFFIINLTQAGLVNEPYATDISPGMVEVCLRNARNVGIHNMKARAVDAEKLPFDDDFFDLVVGHAVLHHLPDVEASFREAFRVLKPGGALVIAGEPTRIGFAIVGMAKRATATAMKTVGAGLGLTRSPANKGEADPEAALEAHVDLHEFHPHMVEAWAKKAGFVPVRIETEEFVSGIFGWSVRTIEALARPGLLGEKWAWFAYRNYMRLYKLDNMVTRRILPKPLFYNLLLYAEKPKHE
ncbi:MAG TPA: methyltransferase domain-containing protein [Actinomycetota bacterium]|nr:methyltransferase domain-containing protein [Actinomycetota bacterium]